MNINGWLQLLVPPVALVSVLLYLLLHRDTNRRDSL